MPIQIKVMGVVVGEGAYLNFLTGARKQKLSGLKACFYSVDTHTNSTACFWTQ